MYMCVCDIHVYMCTYIYMCMGLVVEIHTITGEVVFEFWHILTYICLYMYVCIYAYIYMYICMD